MADVVLDGVGKVYPNGFRAVEDLDLEVRDGEFLVLVGPSGCGKSTLLRMIAGLERISSGTLEIDDMVVNDVPPAQRGIAMVFQSYALYPHMTVRDNMAFALKLAKKTPQEITLSVCVSVENVAFHLFYSNLQSQTQNLSVSFFCFPSILKFVHPV